MVTGMAVIIPTADIVGMSDEFDSDDLYIRFRDRSVVELCEVD